MKFFEPVPIYKIGPVRMSNVDVTVAVPRCCPVCMSPNLEGPYIRPHGAMLWECMRPDCGQHFVIASELETPTLRKITEKLNESDSR